VNSFLISQIEMPDGDSLERKRRVASNNKELKRKLRVRRDSKNFEEALESSRYNQHTQ